MVTLVALVIWRQPIYVVTPFFLVFATLDGLYLSSVLLKVPDGAWFTLVLAALLSSIFVLWRFGKESQWRAEASDKVAPWNLLTELQCDDSEKTRDEPDLSFTARFGGGSISRLRGVGIFFDKTGSPNVTPTVFVHFLQKFQAAPIVTVFFHIRPLSCPSVEPEDRFSVSRCRKADLGLNDDEATFGNIYYVIMRHGYADNDFIFKDLGLLIYENIRAFIIREGSLRGLTNEASVVINNGSAATDGIVSTPDTALRLTDNSATETPDQTLARYRRISVRHRLSALQSLYEDQVVYIVGKEHMRINQYSNWGRKIALSTFLWLKNNTGKRVENMKLETERSVEVGFIKVV